MKTTWLVLCLVMAAFIAPKPCFAQDPVGQDSTGLPGDDFSLSGALEMFQKAGSPEEFERMLNTEDNHVNNLDLNGDGEIDYIQVIDTMRGNVHAFVLRAVLSPTESQDVAVIEVQKKGNANAVVQIEGDRDLYGDGVIVEPGEAENVKTDNGGDRTSNPPPPPVVVNVWGWPCVRYVYAPGYVAWFSPWRWSAYPGWWHPWRPFAWRVYHPYALRYRAGFVFAPRRRVFLAHRIYAPMRRSSIVVRSRYKAAINHYRDARRTTIKARPGHERVKAEAREGRGKTREGKTRTREGKRRR